MVPVTGSAVKTDALAYGHNQSNAFVSLAEFNPSLRKTNILIYHTEFGLHNERVRLSANIWLA